MYRLSTDEGLEWQQGVFPVLRELWDIWSPHHHHNNPYIPPPTIHSITTSDYMITPVDRNMGSYLVALVLINVCTFEWYRSNVNEKCKRFSHSPKNQNKRSNATLFSHSSLNLIQTIPWKFQKYFYLAIKILNLNSYI